MTEHRMSQSKEYAAWRRMKSCCLNPKFPYYHRYGGIGVKICPEWNNSFSQFLMDMGPIPPECNGLVRLDEKVDFIPPNCKWGQKSKASTKTKTKKTPKIKHHKCKNSLNDPKTIALSLERDHLEFINGQALKKSIQNGFYISAPQLIREALQKAFPAPKQFDMFGDKIG